MKGRSCYVRAQSHQPVEIREIKDKHSHDSLIYEIKRKLPVNHELFSLAYLFKILGDTIRIRILFALLESELCVFAIFMLLNMTHS